jgi:hypothetical protein
VQVLPKMLSCWLHAIESIKRPPKDLYAPAGILASPEGKAV